MLDLPDFPWDRLTPSAEVARAHPLGCINASMGTPVDPTPAVIQEALGMAANSPGYPLTHGGLEVREAISTWFARRRGVPHLDPACAFPTVGSKELVALLPMLLGVGTGQVVAFPEIAYPTYDVGARIAGARPVTYAGVDHLVTLTGLDKPALVWVNSPSNPTGRVLSVEDLRAVVQWARSNDVVVVSDECYAELCWEVPESPSILDPRVCDNDHTGLLALYSLSKQSNLAGYRAAFAAGCRTLVARLVEVRKHAGLIVPGPVQAAMTVALCDDDHVAEQRAAYERRRAFLVPAFVQAGFHIEDSQAGLYLWMTRNESGWITTQALAERGVLVAPGDFYGVAGSRHVRFALTITDDQARALPERIVLNLPS